MKCTTFAPLSINNKALQIALSTEKRLINGFVRINRSEIVNLNYVDGFEGNCYYIGKNPLYATGAYRQRMEGVFVKAAIGREQNDACISSAEREQARP